MQFFLELKEKLKYFYSRYDRLLIAIGKFVFVFVLLTVIEKNTGYCTLIDKPVLLHLALALVCAVAPTGILTAVGAGYLVLQLWYTSKEAAIMLGMMYFLVFCLYFIFHPGNSWLTVLTLLFSFWKCPAAVWVCAGMITNPFAVIPVVFGLVIRDYLAFVQNNLTTLTSTKTVLTMPERLIFLTGGIIGDESKWILFFVAFLTIGISFIIRKIPVKYSWIVAAVTSAVCSMLFTILGGYLFELNVNVAGCVIGSLLGLAFLMLYYFLVYSLNYDRMELIQFEDEDYVYYVKAIPKTSLPRQQISFKTFAKRGGVSKDQKEEQKTEAENEEPPIKTEVVSSGKTGDTAPLPLGNEDDQPEINPEADEFATKPIETVKKEVKSSLGATAPVILKEEPVENESEVDPEKEEEVCEDSDPELFDGETDEADDVDEEKVENGEEGNDDGASSGEDEESGSNPEKDEPQL